MIRHGGNTAFFAPGPDIIQMPPIETFRDVESYYATLGHEHIHNADIRIMPNCWRRGFFGPGFQLLNSA
jgi:antirestriction protein ArdC